MEKILKKFKTNFVTYFKNLKAKYIFKKLFFEFKK